jgi:hypothetical protein
MTSRLTPVTDVIAAHLSLGRHTDRIIHLNACLIEHLAVCAEECAQGSSPAHLALELVSEVEDSIRRIGEQAPSLAEADDAIERQEQLFTIDLSEEGRRITRDHMPAEETGAPVELTFVHEGTTEGGAEVVPRGHKPTVQTTQEAISHTNEIGRIRAEARRLEDIREQIRASRYRGTGSRHGARRMDLSEEEFNSEMQRRRRAHIQRWAEGQQTGRYPSN